MNALTKGISPFYPGQPVPAELFVGRQAEIDKIARAVRQVELGKPQAIFLSGEYGIGKSSLAGFMRFYAEKENHLLGIHVLLGSATTIEDVAVKTVEAVLRAPAYEPTLIEKARNVLSKYVGKQELFGIQINLEALKADSPNISAGYLPFLQQLLERFRDEGIKGIMLILDEINGITSNPKFAHFVKGLVDENALSATPLPLLLMLSGVEERRREMIQHHQPVERIFDIVEINPMTDSEMRDFFDKAFRSQNIEVKPDAMSLLCHYSAGFPKIMHTVGDVTFWIDQDGIIDKDDAFKGILLAAEDIGRKFVDQQVLRALRSADYHSILNKMSKLLFDLSFQKTDLEKGLSDSEKKKCNNFLQKMKKLKVLSSGDIQGEYIFNSRLVRLYILLNSIKKDASQ
ncbi:MAG: ATP-binding protein [Nitrospinae bacterium]|nr:ATP-binding protein [Nitrospinota bacterium]